MVNRFISCLSLALGLAGTTIAETDWLEISARPRQWPDSLPLLTARRSVLVLDMPTMTHVRSYLRPSPKLRATSEQEVREQVAVLWETLPAQEKVELKLEWLGGDAKLVDFKRAIQVEEGIVRSKNRVGTTTITRTVLATDDENAVFIHLLADQPGALSFRVRLGVTGEGELKIEDRRQFVRPAAEDRPGSLGAHVWVLPFESDVTPEENSITVRGEGEALILVTCAPGREATEPLAATLTRLGARFDPGHSPPDPSKIWQGVLAAQLKSAENSP